MYGDVETENLLQEFILQHEKMAWMLRAHLGPSAERAYVKEKVRPRSLFLYNVIKFGAIGAGVLFVVATYYLLTTALTDM